jgi:CRISPR-associated exonuclease Cas4
LARLISAADIEKFGYCPLSWTLSWDERQGIREELEDGKHKHEDIAHSVSEVKKLERRALTMERIVLYCAVIATVVAYFGIDLLPFMYKPSVSQIMVVISLIWILAALFFLRTAFKTPIKGTRLQYERLILLFALVAVIIALNGMLFLWVSEDLAEWLETAALIWLVAASFFLQRSLAFSQAARNLKKELHIKGNVEYVDLDGSKLLTSERYGISGRPDYVLLVEGSPIPVEEKTGRVPKGPLFSHILQVATYCLLLEEKTGKNVPYGILKYGAHQHIIEFDESLKKTLFTKIQEMSEIADGKPAHRNHNRPNKCAGCSRKEICPERLA